MGLQFVGVTENEIEMFLIPEHNIFKELKGELGKFGGKIRRLLNPFSLLRGNSPWYAPGSPPSGW